MTTHSAATDLAGISALEEGQERFAARNAEPGAARSRVLGDPITVFGGVALNGPFGVVFAIVASPARVGARLKGVRAVGALAVAAVDVEVADPVAVSGRIVTSEPGRRVVSRARFRARVARYDAVLVSEVAVVALDGAARRREAGHPRTIPRPARCWRSQIVRRDARVVRLEPRCRIGADVGGDGRGRRA